MPLDPAQGEQGHEARDDDRRRKEDRAVDLRGRIGDDREPARKFVMGANPMHQICIGDAYERALCQVPIDIFDHQHRGIDDQPEVDGADRQQVGRLATRYHEADSKRKRERYGSADDDGCAHVAQESPLHQEDQRDSEQHVVQHRMGRNVDEFAAIVNLLDADTRGKDARGIDLVDLGFDAANGWQAFLSAAHQHDALHNVVLVVITCYSEAWLIAHGYRGDVAEQHGKAIARRQHGAANLVHRMNQPDPAHHGCLRPEIDGLAPDIDIAVVEGLQHLRQREPILDEARQVDRDLVSLGLAAPAVDVDHPWDRLESTLEYPVLDSLKVGYRIPARPS